MAEKYKCPDCGADMSDWRSFPEKTEIDKARPFECSGFRCGKRWSEEEIINLQDFSEGENE
ncbi:hypothetical protein A4G19_11950 [Pasteurellaceae bacterium Macca]|nr:hypothetical protein [Pasteurellaceae bacterium Macca]